MILVTGAAGFIGSNVVAGLNEAGRSDIIVCDFLRREEKWLNLRKRSFVDFVRPDQIDAFLAREPDITTVIHMGAISSTTASDGDEIMDRNFCFSLKLLDWCTRQGAQFIYASSAATYGDGEHGFVDDNDPAAIQALRPLNLYGWSKRQFDFVVADRAARGVAMPPRWLGFRFFNVFGPNEYHKGDMKSVVTKIFTPISLGETVSLFKSHRPGISNGAQRRDFIYVRDIVQAVQWGMTAEAKNGIFNLGTGHARSFRDLATGVFSAIGRKPSIEYIDMPGDIRQKYQYFTEASLDKLREAGYKAPFTSLEDAINHYVQTFLASSDVYR